MKITEEYIDLNTRLHEKFPSYGTSGKNWADAVAFLHKSFDFKEILDYGCGKQTLAAALPTLKIVGYDPAIPIVSERPVPAELVVCGDVLEHIEPELLDEVILDLHMLSKKMTFIVLSTREAKKTLSDGRNAHLIVKSPVWWIKKFENKFDILVVHFKKDVSELILLMVPRRNKVGNLIIKYRWFKSINNAAGKFYRACYAK
jgi:2-polyprenyl-3-methyl-5-hydroxy-6-metoxy-1,4-benzoquinol methylase